MQVLQLCVAECRRQGPECQQQSSILAFGPKAAAVALPASTVQLVSFRPLPLGLQALLDCFACSGADGRKPVNHFEHLHATRRTRLLARSGKMNTEASKCPPRRPNGVKACHSATCEIFCLSAPACTGEAGGESSLRNDEDACQGLQDDCRSIA